MDAEGARLVAGRADDAAFVRATAAHDDRLAAQLRAIALFDRREERVEVDMEDRPDLHRPIVASFVQSRCRRCRAARMPIVAEDDAAEGDAADGDAAGERAADEGARGASDLLGILLVIVMLAFGLQFFDLAGNPPELFEDELSGLVSIRSIATTGHDVEQTVLPFLTTRLELKQPLYFVATLPVQALLGPTTMAARLPAVLFGVLGVLLIAGVVVVLGGGTSVALLAAGLYAIAPWAIHYGRAGWEPAAFLPFTLAGIALLWVGLRDHRRWWTIGAAIVLAVGSYAYHPALLMHVVMAGAVVLVRRRDLGRGDARHLAAGALLAGLILVPYGLAITNPLFLERTRGISVFRLGLTPATLIQAWQNYWAQWDPGFLFGGRATNPRINPGPLLFAWTIPFMALGFDRIVHRRSTMDLFLIAWLLLGPLPAALTEDGTTPHAARGLVALPAILIVTAIGLERSLGIIDRIRTQAIFRPAILALVAVIAFGASAAWAVDYYRNYPVRSANWWGYGTAAAFGLAEREVPAGATLCIATNDISRFTFPHQVAYYLPDPPFRIIEGLKDPTCAAPGTYVLALASRKLGTPSRELGVARDVMGKPFFVLDQVTAAQGG